MENDNIVWIILVKIPLISGGQLKKRDLHITYRLLLFRFKRFPAATTHSQLKESVYSDSPRESLISPFKTSRLGKRQSSLMCLLYCLTFASMGSEKNMLFDYKNVELKVKLWMRGVFLSLFLWKYSQESEKVKRLSMKMVCAILATVPILHNKSKFVSLIETWRNLRRKGCPRASAHKMRCWQI